MRFSEKQNGSPFCLYLKNLVVPLLEQTRKFIETIDKLIKCKDEQIHLKKRARPAKPYQNRK
jgi:hypothetical protein